MGSSLPPLLLLAVVALAGAHKMPSYLKTCKQTQTEADYNGCLKKAMQDSLPFLFKGTPDLPPLEPLHFTQIKIEGTPQQPVALNLEFNEVDVVGISKGVIDSIEMKPGSYHMKAKFHTESPISLIGPYKADGKILVLPIKGEGNIRLTAARMDSEMELIGKPIERDGEIYFDVTDFKVSLKNFNKLTIDMTGLFKHDKSLADNTLRFLNENSVEIANEVKPALEDAMGAAFKAITRRLFDKIPYNSIFPPA